MIHARITTLAVVTARGGWDITSATQEDQLVLRKMRKDIYLPHLHDVVERWKKTTVVPPRDRKMVAVGTEKLEIVGEAGKVVAVGVYNPDCRLFFVRFLAPWQEPAHHPTLQEKSWRVGYEHADVVVAMNPVMTVQGSAETVVKYTIARRNSHVPCDIAGATAELATLESGWGGRDNVAGSPQGISSQLTLAQVVEVVGRHMKEGE